MEEVLEKLSNTVVSETTGSAFDSLFKNRGRQGSQDERRQWLLESQKRQRQEKLDLTRGILELVEEVETEMDWSHGDTQRSGYRPRAYIAGFHRQLPSYRNTLMLSEWMVERPADLEENWYIVPCPKGTRVLLVATKGRTKCFSKKGQFMFEGRSALPGGHPTSSRNAASVLDCVWSERDNTMYVLDLLAWNNQTMTDCDTEFRHFWLTGKVQESASLRVVSKCNHYKFYLLPKLLCTPDNLNQFMSQSPMFENNSPALDGLLLYHHCAHYMHGTTPLVGWLYPYMVQEVLGQEIEVHEDHKSPPDGYTTQADFIVKFEQKHNRSSRRSSKNTKIEVDTAPPQSENASMDTAASVDSEERQVVANQDAPVQSEDASVTMDLAREEDGEMQRIVEDILGAGDAPVAAAS